MNVLQSNPLPGAFSSMFKQFFIPFCQCCWHERWESWWWTLGFTDLPSLGTLGRSGDILTLYFIELKNLIHIRLTFIWIVPLNPSNRKELNTVDYKATLPLSLCNPWNPRKTCDPSHGQDAKADASRNRWLRLVEAAEQPLGSQSWMLQFKHLRIQI